ncbi:MAG TPA: UDP-N-acetylmuramoyl-tripeptide--D-alanyl-D-alanine ligase [Eudoraea sp.]|nr:UDP-N-acetylmuramoyl-tripeptide--D-alanyl-D-alanine ligase [Eudoraea sp.]
MTIKELHRRFIEHGLACTDTRNIRPDSIFFALKGPNFNGNAFAEEALNRGAAYAVIEEEKYAVSEQIILVDNVLEVLQNLATYHRNYCSAKVIALTGSNGKTTTKELIEAVLSRRYRTIATKGNLNNHIGVPLTLLSIRPDTELAIVEMGANHEKEIAFLSDLAQPDFGYVTNFGMAHLEGFGSREGVIRGKSELYDYLMAHHRTIFMNADDPVQLEKLGTYVKKVGYSSENHPHYLVKLVGAHPYVTLEFEECEVRTRLVGNYNFTNCCAAVLIGKYFNVPPGQIREALENYIPENNRSQVIEKNGHHIILDAYNANPTSMKAALENFKGTSGKHKVVFLGDMFELGKAAEEEHQKIADMVLNMDLDRIYLIGDHFNKVDTPLQKFASYDSMASHLSKEPLLASTILIKGSRGMALERLLELL